MFNMTAFLTYALVVTFTPGPNNIMSMVTASRLGYKQTLSFILGVVLGFITIMLLSSYFNLLLFKIIPTITTYMGILGAMYMVYLAVKTMKPEKSLAHKIDEEAAIPHDDLATIQSSSVRLFLTGLTLQFVNPKAILYGITIIANFIIPFYTANLTLFLISLFLGFIALLATSSWALFGSLFKRFLSRYQKPFNILMGLLLIYSAYTISGISQLFK